jgi:hypothetical protein
MFGGGISHEEGNSVEPNALFTGNSSRDTNNVVEEKLLHLTYSWWIFLTPTNKSNRRYTVKPTSL